MIDNEPRTIIGREATLAHLNAGQYKPPDLLRIAQITPDLLKKMTDGKISPPDSDKRFELITGASGSGKSTLAREMMSEPGRIPHSILIDPDDIRQQTGLHDKKWNAAIRYLVRKSLDAANAGGYAIVATVNPGDPLIKSIFARAESQGYRLKTSIIHAPLQVCKDSVLRRMESGGHPGSDPSDLESDHIYAARIYQSLSGKDMTAFWRPKPEASPVRVKTSHDGGLLTKMQYNEHMRDFEDAMDQGRKFIDPERIAQSYRKAAIS